MTQFTKVYNELFNQGCKPNQAMVLAIIYDRMESSRQRVNFYSDTYNDYFVIYTYEELANELNLSISSVRRVISNCVENGYLIVHHINNRVNGIFMTKKSKNIAGFDDIEVPTKNNASVQNEQVSVQNEQLIKLNNYTKKTNVTDITENLKSSIVQKMNLPQSTVNGLDHLVKHNNKQLHHIISILLKAKARVNKELPQTINFEDNNIQKVISSNVYGIVKRALKTKNVDAYLFASFVRMFKVPFTKQTTKPVIKACNAPSWLHTPYEQRQSQYSDTEIKQAETKVNEFMKNYKKNHYKIC